MSEEQETLIGRSGEIKRRLRGIFVESFSHISMMRKMMRVAALAIVAVFFLFLLASCREADRVQWNIGVEADSFNVTRRLEVINARTDAPILEIVGNFALKNNSSKELEIIIELKNGIYKKHFVYLNEYTLYVVEDLSGSDVTPYHYEINVLPQTFQTFDLIYKP